MVTVQPDLTQDHRGRRLAGVAIAGAGVVVSVAGFFVYRAGADKVGAINQATARGGTYDPSDGNWRTLANAGTGAMVVGGAAIITGSVLYLWSRKADTSTSPSAHLGLSHPVNGRWMPQLWGTF
jgi:hypothetical protein